jgi:hypothetical protein
MTPTNEVIPNSDYSAYILPGINAIATPSVKVAPITSPLIKSEDSSVMAKWGDDNDFPQKVIADIRKDPEIGTLLSKKAALLYSGGLVYGIIKKGSDGSETMTPLPEADDLKISDWLRKSNIKRYLLEAATDLYYFGNVFPETVLNVGKTEIIQLCVQASESCRFSKQNNAGVIDTCFINANFPDDDENNKRTKKLPVIDPYYDPAANLKTISAKGFNFIYPISYPSPGSKYYQLTDWNSIRESGWLAVSQAIPKFKKSLLEKQLNIKYHIEISDQFWPLKYSDWSTIDEAKRQLIKKTELENFQKLLAGAEKNGNSLVTPFKSDFNLGKEFSLWKITAIDDKIKAGQFLEEGKDASLYKMSAIGLHPALVGTMPNNGLGGAGSNIREAYNLHMMMITAHQDIILEPLNNLIKYYNGWNEQVEFRFKNSFMNTLDKGTETTKKIG